MVVEMVRALSWSTLLWLYLLFLVRLGGWETERPDAWREVVLTAIPKKSDKVGFRSMRYISLLPMIQKFYIRALQWIWRVSFVVSCVSAGALLRAGLTT